MHTMCSREIFTKKCQQQQIFDSDLKGAWHYNHVTFTRIAKNFMLYCRLIYMISILCVRLMIKVKVGIPESFKVGWYPQKKQFAKHDFFRGSINNRIPQGIDNKLNEKQCTNYHFHICKTRPMVQFHQSPLQLDLDPIFLSRESLFQVTIS